jgi:hypothetical protein
MPITLLNLPIHNDVSILEQLARKQATFNLDAVKQLEISLS